MTPEEKLIKNIRDWFIVTDGDFLKLSEKDQNDLISSMIQLHVGNLKNEK